MSEDVYPLPGKHSCMVRASSRRSVRGSVHVVMQVPVIGVSMFLCCRVGQPCLQCSRIFVRGTCLQCTRLDQSCICVHSGTAAVEYVPVLFCACFGSARPQRRCPREACTSVNLIRTVCFWYRKAHAVCSRFGFAVAGWQFRCW